MDDLPEWLTLPVMVGGFVVAFLYQITAHPQECGAEQIPALLIPFDAENRIAVKSSKLITIK